MRSLSDSSEATLQTVRKSSKEDSKKAAFAKQNSKKTAMTERPVKRERPQPKE